MKNSKLQKWLSELPDDAEVCVSKIFLIKDKKKTLYTCRLDSPILGLAKTKDNKEICFMLEYSKNCSGLGKIKKI